MRHSLLIFTFIVSPSLAFADPVSIVSDYVSGPAALADAAPKELVVVGDTLFFVASDPQNGKELWKSDGTELGTVLVRDLTPGPAGSNLRGLTAFNGALFFLMSDREHGEELWTSDGSVFGTMLVKDIEPGPASSNIASLVVANGLIYFGAQTTAEGSELWRSDGTSAGTFVLPVTPGATG
jgi:ELWxxDGT repeat protein